MIRNPLITIITLCVLSNLDLTAQGDLLLDNPAWAPPILVPPSPTAASLGRYGEQPIGLFAGTQNVSIPLFQIQGKESSLPISLSYSTSGIKVEEMASWVGLGWSMMSGGVITRSVVGLPDDGAFEWSDASNVGQPTCLNSFTNTGSYKNYFNTYSDLEKYREGIPLCGPVAGGFSQVQEYLDFQESVMDRLVETQPDIYYYNVNGLSGSILMDHYGDVATLPYKPYEIVPGVGPQKDCQGWVITTDDGTIYTFKDRERTYLNDELINVQNLQYFSSWYLTTMQSSNGQDIYNFEYETTDMIQEDPVSFVTQSTTDPISPSPECGSSKAQTHFNTSILRRNYQFLKRITTNRGIEIEFHHEDRLDQPGSKLTNGFTVYYRKTTTDTPTILKDVKFYQSYLGNPNSPIPNLELRLRMDSLSIGGSDQVPEQWYRFVYETGELPSRSSNSVDWLGYFNGKGSSGAGIKVAEMELSGRIYPGQDRSFDLANSKIGVLKQITYPTGGYTEYDYEGHDLVSPAVTEEVSNDHEVSICGGEVPLSPILPALIGDNDFNQTKYRVTTFSLVGNESKLEMTINVQACAGQLINGGGYYYIGLYKIGDFPDLSNPNGSQKPLMASISDLVRTFPYQQGSNVYELITRGPNDLSPSDYDMGEYQLVVANSLQNFEISARLEVTSRGFSNEKVHAGGIRVKSVKDVAANGEVVKRIFNYSELKTFTLPKTLPQPLESHGGLLDWLSKPLYYEQDLPVSTGRGSSYGYGASFDFTFQDNTLCAGGVFANGSLTPEGDCGFLNRYQQSPASLGTYNGNPVVYSRVEELRVDANDISLGKTVYEYDVGQSTSGRVTASSKTGGLLLSKREYDANDQIKHAVINTYDQDNNPIVVSRGLAVKGGNFIPSTGMFRFLVSNSQNTCKSIVWQCSGLGGDLISNPETIGDNYSSSAVWMNRLRKKVEKNYGNSITNVDSTVVEYFYDNVEHTQANRVYYTNAQEGVNVQVKKYPSDYNTNSPAFIPALIGQNKKSSTIESSSYRVDNNKYLLLGGSILKYDDFGINVLENHVFEGASPRESNLLEATSNGYIIPSDFNNTIEEISYQIVDPIEILTRDGIRQSISWEYPLGKVSSVTQNARSNQSVFESFENDGEEGPALSGIKSKRLSSGNSGSFLIDDGSYVLCFGYRSGTVNLSNVSSSQLLDTRTIQGWTYARYSVTVDSGFLTINGTALIDNVRIYPPKAMMTSYNYKPYIGVSSITHPDESMTFYEYDPFGRLYQVKDQEGNVIQETKYNYKN